MAITDYKNKNPAGHHLLHIPSVHVELMFDGLLVKGLVVEEASPTPLL